MVELLAGAVLALLGSVVTTLLAESLKSKAAKREQSRSDLQADTERSLAVATAGQTALDLARSVQRLGQFDASGGLPSTQTTQRLVASYNAARGELRLARARAAALATPKAAAAGKQILADLDELMRIKVAGEHLEVHVADEKVVDEINRLLDHVDATIEELLAPP